MVPSSTPHGLALLLLVLALPAAAMSACAGEDFPSGRSYATCQDLPELGAALHWTYEAATSASTAPSLSLAFVAAPAAPGGWVGWGINPTGAGMVGTQALVALAAAGGTSSSSPAPTVRTYNITDYAPLGNASTPIAFQASGLAADVGSGGGRIRLYATLRLEKGMKVVNHVWQVGPSVTRGAPDMHAMAPENLAAMGKLDLTMGAAAASPPAAATVPSSRSGNGNGGDGSISQAAADTASVVSTALSLLVLALLGFWATMV